MAYTPQTWHDSPTSDTPISAARLTVMENGIQATAAAADSAAKIAGDLAGEPSAPTVAKVNGVAITGTPTAGQVPTATSGTAAAWATPAAGGGGASTVPMRSGAYHFNAVGGGLTNGVFAPTAGTLYAVPFLVSASTTFVALATNVGTGGAAGALLRFGVYATTTGGLPGALVLDAGTADATTTGDKAVTINTTLAPGLYFVVEVVNDATARLRALGNAPQTNTTLGLGIIANGPVQNDTHYYTFTGYTTGALPATATTAGFTPVTGDVPLIALKAA